MKKIKVFSVLNLLSALLISGCTTKTNSSESSSKQEDSNPEITSSKADSESLSSVNDSSSKNASSSSINSSVAPVSSSSSALSISSSEQKQEGEQKITVGPAPTDTSSLTSNCKSYIDAMREQQSKITEDYKARTLGEDKAKIENYLDAKGISNANKSDKSRGVNVTFSVASGYEADSYEIQYSTGESFTNPLKIAANPSGTLIKNLYSNTKYYWKVVGSNGITSDVGNFTTGDYTRWIDAYELYNVRDVGGYMTSSGKRVKQGLIYRGGEITDAAWGSDHAKTVSDNSKRIFRDVMGCKVEVDFRMDSQIGDSLKNTHKCHFANNGDIEYKQIYLESFKNTVTRYTSQIKQVFEIFAQADKKPVYFHCHGGADRTGTIGMLLLSLLGVSYTDVVIDYELTSYSGIKGGDCLRRHYQAGTYNDWPGLMSTLEGMSGVWNKSNTLAQNVESFLKSKCSISQTTIDTIRNIMIEK